jgi:putative membrane protein
MMGFGFVVARFGIFLNEIAAAQVIAPPRQHGLSLWVGTTLVVLGVIVNLCAAIKHWRTVRRLQRGQLLEFKPLSLGVLVAGLLGLLGLMMAAYLVFGLSAPQ